MSVQPDGNGDLLYTTWWLFVLLVALAYAHAHKTPAKPATPIVRDTAPNALSDNPLIWRAL